jgi:hypothetical protein
MKTICSLILALLVLLATDISAAEFPDLLGKWTGSWSSYDEGKGYFNATGQGQMIFAFNEQKERIFAGNLTIMQGNETLIEEGFAGAIGLDNKSLYITEFEEGYAQGTIISGDEMELIYCIDGNNASVAVDRLRRVTA